LRFSFSRLAPLLKAFAVPSDLPICFVAGRLVKQCKSSDLRADVAKFIVRGAAFRNVEFVVIFSSG